MKPRVEVVGEFTEAHAKGLMEISYRIWKRHLTEQAEQRRREREAIATQTSHVTSL